MYNEKVMFKLAQTVLHNYSSKNVRQICCYGTFYFSTSFPSNNRIV